MAPLGTIGLMVTIKWVSEYWTSPVFECLMVNLKRHNLKMYDECCLFVKEILTLNIVGDELVSDPGDVQRL